MLDGVQPHCEAVRVSLQGGYRLIAGPDAIGGDARMASCVLTIWAVFTTIIIGFRLFTVFK